MTINDILTAENISKYRLSKCSGVPYATLNDICNGKSGLGKCSAEKVYRLSKTLGIPMETLLEPYLDQAVLDLPCIAEERPSEAETEKAESADQAQESASVQETAPEQTEASEPCPKERPSFESFRNEVCKRVKKLGDFVFLVDTLQKDDIHRYARWNWEPECLYLLAMTDYLSRCNGLALSEKYSELRTHKLPEELFALSVSSEEGEMQEPIPEFFQFNLIETDIRSIP